MDESQPTSPRRRLQALLAIPANQLSDAQWDEINELEIMLAPGNRSDAPEPGPRRNLPPVGAPRSGGAPKSGGGQAKKPFKKFHKKPPKADTQ